MAPKASEQYRELRQHLLSVLGPDTRPLLGSSVLPAVVNSIHLIAHALRGAHQVARVGTANAFGDEQLNVDVLAERIIRSEAANCAAIRTLSSEEDPVERTNEGARSHGEDEHSSSEQYTLAFDPLDGSSIIAPNWTVGTIVGIWDGSTALHQTPSSAQVAAVIGVYGPRTTALIALRHASAAPVCFEVAIGEADGHATCEIVRLRVELPKELPKSRYFAPANLRAVAESEAYLALVNHYAKAKYSLRYIGGLVPDINHILVKGHGVYISPVTQASSAKLRRLYELAPIALVLECAGASAVDPATGLRTLEQPIGDCDERAGLLCGTAEEVQFVKSFFGLQ